MLSNTRMRRNGKALCPVYKKQEHNFQTIRLFDIEGNIINVNSWIECANYVNGGWSNTIDNFSGDTFLLALTIGLSFVYFVGKKFISGKT